MGDELLMPPILKPPSRRSAVGATPSSGYEIDGEQEEQETPGYAAGIEMPEFSPPGARMDRLNAGAITNTGWRRDKQDLIRAQAREDEQQRELLEKAHQQRVVQHNNAVNNSREAVFRSRGVEHYTDASGRIQPVLDESTGKPVHKEKVFAPEYHADGRVTQARRDREGNLIVSDPDESVTWGADPDTDPEGKFIVKKNEYSGWQYEKTEDAIKSGDPKRFIPAAKILHEQELAELEKIKADADSKMAEARHYGKDSAFQESLKEFVPGQTNRQAWEQAIKELSTPIPRPEPSRGWLQIGKATVSERDEQEWKQAEEARKAQLAEAQSKLAAANEYDALFRARKDADDRIKKYKIDGPGGFIRRWREDQGKAADSVDMAARAGQIESDQQAIQKGAEEKISQIQALQEEAERGVTGGRSAEIQQNLAELKLGLKQDQAAMSAANQQGRDLNESARLKNQDALEEQKQAESAPPPEWATKEERTPLNTDSHGIFVVEDKTRNANAPRKVRRNIATLIKNPDGSDALEVFDRSRLLDVLAQAGGQDIYMEPESSKVTVPWIRPKTRQGGSSQLEIGQAEEARAHNLAEDERVEAIKAVRKTDADVDAIVGKMKEWRKGVQDALQKEVAEVLTGVREGTVDKAEAETAINTKREKIVEKYSKNQQEVGQLLESARAGFWGGSVSLRQAQRVYEAAGIKTEKIPDVDAALQRAKNVRERDEILSEFEKRYSNQVLFNSQEHIARVSAHEAAIQEALGSERFTDWRRYSQTKRGRGSNGKSTFTPGGRSDRDAAMEWLSATPDGMAVADNVRRNLVGGINSYIPAFARLGADISTRIQQATDAEIKSEWTKIEQSIREKAKDEGISDRRLLARLKRAKESQYLDTIQRHGWYEFAKTFDEVHQKTLDPRLKDAFFSSKVAQGLGSALQFAAVSGITGGIGGLAGRGVAAGYARGSLAAKSAITAENLAGRGAIGRMVAKPLERFGNTGLVTAKQASEAGKVAGSGIGSRIGTLLDGGILSTDSIQEQVRALGGDPGLLSYVIGGGLGASELAGATASMRKIMGHNSTRDYVMRLLSPGSGKRLALDIGEEAGQEFFQGGGEAIAIGQAYDEIQEAWLKDNLGKSKEDFASEFGEKPQPFSAETWEGGVIGGGIGALFGAIALGSGRARFVRARNENRNAIAQAEQEWEAAKENFTPGDFAARLTVERQAVDPNAPEVTPEQVSVTLDLIGDYQNVGQIESVQAELRTAIKQAEKAGEPDVVIALEAMLADRESRKVEMAEDRVRNGLAAAENIEAARAQAKELQAQAQETGDPVVAEQAAQARSQAALGSAIVKIASGKPLTSLTTEELAAAGLDGEKKEGIPAIVKDDVGNPIITDSSIEQMEQSMPDVANIVQMDEQSVREMFAERHQKEAAAPKEADIESNEEEIIAAPEDQVALPVENASSGTWTARGRDGTTVSIPASEAANEEEAAPKLAAALARANRAEGRQPELLDLDSIEFDEDVSDDGPAEYSQGDGQLSDNQPRRGDPAAAGNPGATTGGQSGAGAGQGGNQGADSQPAMRDGTAGRKSGSGVSGGLPVAGPEVSSPQPGSPADVDKSVKTMGIALERIASRLGLSKGTLSIGEDVGSGNSPVAVPNDDGTIRISFDLKATLKQARFRYEQDGGHGPKYIEDAFFEELVHTADLVASRKRWEAAGKPSGFVDFFKSEKEAHLDDIAKEINRGGKDGAAIAKALIGAAGNYHLSGERGIRGFLAGLPGNTDIEKALALISGMRDGSIDLNDKRGGWRLSAEFLRSVVQARRNGDLTETGYRRVVGLLLSWMRELIGTLKAVGDIPMIAERVREIEQILDDDAQNPVSKTGSPPSGSGNEQVSDPGRRPAAENAGEPDKKGVSGVAGSGVPVGVQGQAGVDSDRRNDQDLDQDGGQRGSQDIREATHGPSEPIQLTADGQLTPESKAIIAKQLGVDPEQIGSVEPVSHRGSKYRTVNALIEADNLNASHDAQGRVQADYPQDLQPRDRSSAVYIQQQRKMARNPDLDEDAKTGSPDNGTPIMAMLANGQNVTLIGNGRSIAKQLMYADPQLAQIAETFKEGQAQRAGEKGLSEAAARQMQQPVAVRVIIDPMSFDQLLHNSKESNRFSGAATNSIEQAKADASRLSPDVMGLFDSNYEIAANRNSEFRDAFVRIVLGGEENITMQELERRIKRAMFSRVYGSTPEGHAAFLRLTGEEDDDTRSITQSMFIFAPELAQLQAKITDGAAYPLDIAPELARAAQDIAGALKNKPASQSAASAMDGLVNQYGLFDDADPPAAKQILEFIILNRRSKARILGGLRAYLAAVEQVGDPRKGSLLDMDAPSKEGVWRVANRAVLEAGRRTELSQIAEVRARYNGTSGWMKAPNGQPTNLTEIQWLQVRTPSFKQWFGDWENDPANASQIADKNGEPMVVYHGASTQDGKLKDDTFDRRKNYYGLIFVTPVRDFAKTFLIKKGNKPLALFAKSTSLFDSQNASDINALRKQLVKDGIKQELAAELTQAILSKDNINNWVQLEQAATTSALRTLGYDGVKMRERGNESFALMDNATQIKSATDNTGEFDSENPNILFASQREDNREQSLWMDAEAKARGFQDVTDLATRDPDTFASMAKQWRIRHARIDKIAETRNDNDSEKLDARLFPTASGSSSERRIASKDAGDSARTFLGRSARSNSSQQGNSSGKAEIVEWAKANGRLITKLPFRLYGPRDFGEGEHHVFYDKVSRRFVKNTRGDGNAFGNTLDLRGRKWNLGRATALQYLDRIQLFNKLTGDDIRVHAVYQDKHGSVNIVTSQPDVRGRPPAAGAVKAYMEDAGFVALGDSAFYRANDNLLVLDLHDLNANEVDGEIMVFDASILQPTQEQLDILRSQGVLRSGERKKRVSKKAIAQYLIKGGAPEAEALKTSERISRTLSQPTTGEAARYEPGTQGRVKEAEQLGFSFAHAGAKAARAALPSGPAATNPSARRRRGSKLRDSPSQDLIDGLRGNWGALAKEVENKGRASSILPDLIDGRIPSWDIIGTRIQSPDDALAVMQPIRSPYFESLKVMVLDKSRNVVHSQIVHVGSLAESIADPVRIFAMLTRIRERTGRKYKDIILSHNHPSGDPNPSNADKAIQKTLKEVALLTGWKILDHIITNGESYYSFRGRGVTHSDSQQAEWEVVKRSELQSVGNTNLIRDVASHLRSGNPNAIHVIYLSTKLQLIGVERISSDDWRDEQKRSQLLLSGVAREGAHGVILSAPNTSEDKAIVMRAVAFSKKANFKVFDAIVDNDRYGELNPTYSSFRAMGIMEDSGEFDFEKQNTQSEKAVPKEATRNWVKTYNRLFNMQQSGKKLSAIQRALLEQAERELGQTLMFDMDALKSDEAERERQRQQIAAKQDQPLIGENIETQPSLDGRPEPGPNGQEMLFASQRGQRVFDLGGYRNPGEFDLFNSPQVDRQQPQSVPQVAPEPDSDQGIEPSSGQADIDPGDLVMENMGLATTIANDYRNIPGVDMDDVIQQARLVLFKAARAYPTSQTQAPFGNYAGRAIRNELNSLYGRNMRVAKNELESLDAPIDDSETTGQEMTPSNEPSIQLSVEQAETTAAIEAVVTKLPERPQAIVRGFMAGKSGEDIAQELGISRQAVNVSLRGALAVMRQKLKEQGFEGQEDGILFASQRKPKDLKDYINDILKKLNLKDDINDMLKELNRNLPTLEEHEAMREKAHSESKGQRTVNDGKKANYAEDDATRVEINVVQQLRKDKFTKQEEAQWVRDARKMLAEDERGVKRRLLNAALSESGLGDPVMVKAAQILVPRLMRRAMHDGNAVTRREALALAWAYDVGGTQDARSLAARKDPYKSPAERHMEFFTKIISRIPREDQQHVDAAPTPQEKAARLAAAHDKRLKQIEDAMKEMGLTLDDIFAPDVYGSVLKTAIKRSAIAKLPKQQAAIARYIMDGFSDKEIAKALGVSNDIVTKGRNIFDAALEAEINAYLDRDLSDDAFAAVSALLSSTRKFTPEQRAAIKARLMRQIRPDTEVANAKKAFPKRKKKPTPKDASKEEREHDEAQPWTYHPRIDMDDKHQVAQVARHLASKDAGAYEKLQEFVINSMLSGPQTNVVNLVGNAANAIWEYSLHRPVEAVIASMIGAKEGTQGVKELALIYKAMLPAMAKGFTDAVRTWAPERDFLSEDYLNQQMDLKLEVEQYSRSAIGGLKGKLIRTPGRLLRLGDTFFKSTVMNAEVAAQAYRIGKAQGLYGDKLQTFMDEQMAPGSLSWRRAHEQALKIAFQQDTPKMVNAITKARNPGRDASLGEKIAAFVMMLHIPFIKTPYNIMATGLRKSPLGVFNMAYHGIKGVDSMRKGYGFEAGYSRAQLASDIAEQTVAWVMASILAFISEGDDNDDDKWLLITGGRSQSVAGYGERDLQTRMHGGSYQIRIGGSNGIVIPYGRIEPLVTVLGTTVDAISSVKRGGKLSNLPAKMIGLVANQMREKTFLSGLDGMMNTLDSLDDPDRAKKSLIRQLGGWIVPNIIRQPLRNWDDVLRDSKFAGMGYTLTAWPGWAEPRHDIYGETMERSGPSPVRLLAPAALKTTDQLGDRLLDNWAKANPDNSYFPRRPNGNWYQIRDRNGELRELTPSQIATLDKLAGKNFSNRIKRWLTPARAANPTESDLERFKKDLSEARSEAKETIARRVLLVSP